MSQAADDIMSDVPAATDIQTGSTISEIGLTNPDSTQLKSGWNLRKTREEMELAKKRLSDLTYNPTDYHDPLLPRNTDSSKLNPLGPSSTKIEQFLMDVMAKIQAGEK